MTDGPGRALKLIEVGRPKEGLQILLQLVAEHPGDARMLCHIAYAHLQLDDNKSALRAADSAVAAAPDLEWGHRLRSVVLGRMHRLAESVAAAEAARKCAPHSPSVINQYFIALHQAKRDGEAKRAAADLLRVAPASYEAHLAVGLSALRDKRPVEAEAEFREALRINPQSWEAQNNLGVALLRQGKRRDSIEAFWGAARTNPLNRYSRKNMRVASTRRATVGGIALFVGAQAVRGAYEASGGAIPDAVWGGFTLIVIAALLVYVFRRPRLGLAPEIEQYLRAERRRENLDSITGLGTVLFGSISAFWFILLYNDRSFRPSTWVGWSVFALITASAAGLLARMIRKRRR